MIYLNCSLVPMAERETERLVQGNGDEEVPVTTKNKGRMVKIKQVIITLLEKLCCLIKNIDEQDIITALEKLVCLLYLLTGQFVPLPSRESKKKSCCTVLYCIVISLTVCLVLNVIPFAITVFDWAACPTRYYNVCYSIMLHPRHHANIPEILMSAKTIHKPGEDSHSLLSAQNELEKFEIYARIVLLVTSFSSTTSYVLFLCAFIKLYFWPHFKICCGREETQAEQNESQLSDEEEIEKMNDKNIKPLHPFDDSKWSENIEITENDHETSTRLTCKEACSFYLMLGVNVSINLAMLGVFIGGQYLMNRHPDEPLKNEGKYHHTQKYEIMAVAIYTYSLFCTLLSCFLFSKLAYGIQRKQNNTITFLKHINVATGNLREEKSEVYDYLQNIYPNRNFEDKSELDVKLFYLQERDKHFTKVATKTIKVFEHWFFFHWILYIASSFLSLSLFLEAIIHYVDSSLPDQKTVTTGIDFHPLEIIFLGLFSVSNCLFFLYPCVRAASITDSRTAQICYINQKYTKYEHITPELKDKFVNFLSGQSFGFSLHILCAKVPFGFSVAYFSIFLAAFGVLLKVASSL